MRQCPYHPLALLEALALAKLLLPWAVVEAVVAAANLPFRRRRSVRCLSQVPLERQLRLLDSQRCCGSSSGSGNRSHQLPGLMAVSGQLQRQSHPSDSRGQGPLQHHTLHHRCLCLVQLIARPTVALNQVSPALRAQQLRPAEYQQDPWDRQQLQG